MARARKTEQLSSDYPHPRTRADLFGHANAEQLLIQAYAAQRLHHAWLLCGPVGIGKATFAYRAARFLLAHINPVGEAVQSATSLFVSSDSKVFHEVEHESNPDCHSVEIEIEKGKPKKFISVDAIRDLSSALRNTAGTGGWRIAIIDSIDQLNINAANALLKILEEPPRNTLFLLISHQPGLLLPTLRSRCQKLQMQPLNSADLRAAAQSVDPSIEIDDERINAAQGSVRQLLDDNGGQGDEERQTMRNILEHLPSFETKPLQQFADSVSRKPDAIFQSVMNELIAFCQSNAMNAIANPVHYANLSAEMAAQAQALTIYNLDKKSFLITQISKLATLAKRKSAA